MMKKIILSATFFLICFACTAQDLYQKWLSEKDARFPHHYSEFLGSYSENNELFLGANYAYTPNKYGLYGSFMYGLYDNYYINVGPVLRLTNGSYNKVDVQLFQGVGLNSGKIAGETGFRFGFGRDKKYGMWSLSGAVGYSSQGVTLTAGMSWPITAIAAMSAAITLYALGLAYLGEPLPDFGGGSSSAPKKQTSPAPVSNAVSAVDCYNMGVTEEEQHNYITAASWYRRAADQGLAAAQYNLGVFYANGRGVTQSYAEAVKWYRRAADQGDAAAQNNLGVCYENGQGVAQSYAEAVKWYRRAADQGLAAAQCNLGVCYESGQGVTQSYAEAVKWYRRAADQGNATAQRRLGFCYRFGKGVKEDLSQAKKWLQLSANQGDALAKGMLDNMKE